MRAVIRVENRLDLKSLGTQASDDLSHLFEAGEWLVKDKTARTLILEEVVQDVPDTIGVQVKAEHLLSLEKGKVKGIVCWHATPVKGTKIEIRLIGGNTKEIKTACSGITEILFNAGYNTKLRLQFEFNDCIEIKEKGTDSNLWIGEVESVHGNKIWSHVLGQEKWQVLVIKIGLIIFLVGVVITHPLFHEPFFPFSKEVYDWLNGHIARLSTAAFFSVLVAFLQIVHQVQKLEREPIKWEHV